MARSSQQIIDQTNELARKLYARLNCKVKHGYRFDKSTHPTELAMWDMACIAQELLTETDPINALSELED